MEMAAVGKPEQQFGSDGDSAEEPDWKEVRGKALDLLGGARTCGSALSDAGSRADRRPGRAGRRPGGAGGVRREVLGRRPSAARPRRRQRSDAAGEYDRQPVRPAGDVLQGIREATLVRSRAMGKFAYRDVQVASGELPPPAGTPKIEQSSIDGAFADSDAGELKATGGRCSRRWHRPGRWKASFADQVGGAAVPQLEPLSDVAAMAKLVNQKLAARGLLGRGSGRAGGRSRKLPRAAPKRTARDSPQQRQQRSQGECARGPHRRHFQPRRCDPRPRQNLRLLQTLRTVESGTVVPDSGETAGLEELFGNSARPDARRCKSSARHRRHRRRHWLPEREWTPTTCERANDACRDRSQRRFLAEA